MTKILIILILQFGLISSAKADTLDYWHVYYNNIKIKEFNQNSRGEIVLKIKDIKKADSLIIKYFRDIPCSHCELEVAIENENHIVIAKGKSRDTFNAIKISVYNLLEFHINADNEVYDVYYQEEQVMTSRTQRELIFRIKLE